MKRAVIIALILILPGCSLSRLLGTKLERPTFAYSGYELAEVSESETTVQFLFSAHNPNKVGIKDVLVSYELLVEGNFLLQGNDIRLVLPPKSDTVIQVPAVIAYKDLLPVLGSLANRILSGQKTVPITINAVFTGKPLIYDESGQGSAFSFEKNLTKTEDIPIPLDKINKAMKRFRDAIQNF